MKKLNLLIVCFCLFLTIAGTFSCKKSSTDDSNTINVSGDWKGTAILPTETDNVTLSLTQSGTNITGTFTQAGTSDPNNNGTVSGTISGSNITLTSVSSVYSGGSSLNATVNSSGTSMSGNFTSQYTGAPSISGTWSLTKN